MRQMLRSIADDLWVAEQRLRYLGVGLTTRMTIVRLADGILMVHSPIHLTDELKSAVASTGRVGFIMAPNRFHHLFVSDWQKAYPDAQTFCAPGLDTKRADLKFTAILGDDPAPAWADQMDQAFMRALPPVNEIVFFHRKSRTVIFAICCSILRAMIPPMHDFSCGSMERSTAPPYLAHSGCCCAAGASSVPHSFIGFCHGISIGRSSRMVRSSRVAPGPRSNVHGGSPTPPCNPRPG